MYLTILYPQGFAWEEEEVIGVVGLAEQLGLGGFGQSQLRSGIFLFSLRLDSQTVLSLLVLGQCSRKSISVCV